MRLFPQPPRRPTSARRLGPRGAWMGAALFRGCLVRGIVCLGIILGPLEAGGWAGARALALAAPAKSAPVFERLTRLWEARDADGVAGLLDPQGTGRFTLLAYPMSGKARSMKPAQARVSLKAYFSKISRVRLKDVTPRGSPSSVRHYEFHYRPARENQRKTRLQVQLKRDRKGSWRLASVTESR